jgi:hypothetical protein
MKSPVAAWRSGTRWPLLTIGILAALLVIVLICEAAGWPFLVGPVQRTLAKTLDREVVFGTSADDPGVRIGLLGSVRVQASSIRIGAPAWSKEAHMVQAEDAQLRLGYLDLFRAWRGGKLHVSRSSPASSMSSSSARPTALPPGSSGRRRSRTRRRNPPSCRRSACSRWARAGWGTAMR